MANIYADTNNKNYQVMRERLGNAKYNGLYYYSKVIEQYIIPRVETDRPWNTISVSGVGGTDRMICFIHNNLDAKPYTWLNRYDEIVIICSARHMVGPMTQYGHVVYLPLSIDIDEVKEFGKGIKKDQDACFIGNPWPALMDQINKHVPPEVHRFGTMPREKMLPIVAHYKNVYAIGMAALEARALGAKIHRRYDRYGPDDYLLLDCKDAAKALQKALHIIDVERKPGIVDCTDFLKKKGKQLFYKK